MTSLNEFAVGFAVAVASGAVGWLVRPIFDRPRRTLYRAFAGPPIAVEVQVLTEHMSDVPALYGPTSFVFDGQDPLYPSPEPRGVDAWQAWAYRNAGEDVGTSIVQVTLQGLTDDPISIEAPAIAEHSKMQRRANKCFGPGGLGGGGVLPRNYLFVIDGDEITRAFEEQAGRPEAFQLASGETERLTIRVEVRDLLRHEWTLSIPYIRRGRRDSIVVSRGPNRPFATNGYDGLEHWLAVGAQRWVRRRVFHD